MKNMEDVIAKVDAINDFMYTVEGAMIDATIGKLDDRTKRLHSLVYILMDLLHTLGEDIGEVNGNIKVCNAILASAHVREMEEELKALKETVNSNHEDTAAGH